MIEIKNRWNGSIIYTGEHTDIREAVKAAVKSGSNLSGSNLDFSAWPLCCGSCDVAVDVMIARQLAYHFCRLECDDPEYIAARNALVEFANKSHLIKIHSMPLLEKMEERNANSDETE
ncbi:hypothetical protein LLG39_17765 [bacterium]|nr:hypothetical protein [bacterium]